MSDNNPHSGKTWSTVAAQGLNKKVPPPYRRDELRHNRDLYSVDILFEDPSVTEYRKNQQIASIVQTALTPGSVIFTLPLTRFARYTDAYREVVKQIGPVCNNGFNPLSLRGARSSKDFIFSTKFLDPEDTKVALETGITLDEIQFKALPYKDKTVSNTHLRINLTLTSYDSDPDTLVDDLQKSMAIYGKVVQIKQRLNEGFFEGEISVLLDRSAADTAGYKEPLRMLYLEAWDAFFPASFFGAPPVLWYLTNDTTIKT